MEFFRDLIPPNQMNPGDFLYSATRAFRLAMQEDGNLVLYAIDDANLPKDITKASYSRAIWSSRTMGSLAGQCRMQNDGNLVLYISNDGPAVWATGTNGHPGAFLRCQDDGNLVIFDANGAVLLNSNSNVGAH